MIDKIKMYCVLGLLATVSMPALAQVTIDFDELPLAAESYYNGADGKVNFTSQGVAFQNEYSGGMYKGFCYSNMSNTTTAGFANQYSAITGSGVGSAGNYATCYVGNDWQSGTYDQIPVTVTLPVATTVSSLMVTNTTYAYLAIHDTSDGNATPFVKEFTEGDYFKLSIEGFDSTGQSLGVVDQYLADYRSPNTADWFVLDAWTQVDLTGLGNEVKSLQFVVNSTDAGAYGINTPSYFAMDDLVVAEVPEPATIALLTIGGVALLRRRKA